MLKTGLVSITFRKLDIKEIVSMVKKAKLDAIEWGGDVHVPHGKTNIARETAKICRGEGVDVTSYGSYYRTGFSEGDGLSFNAVSDSAAELGVSTIRVWAGKDSSADMTTKQRQEIVEDIIRINKIAAKENITISTEYHPNTLTDTTESAIRLFKELGEDSPVKTYWQPPYDTSRADPYPGLIAMKDNISNIHVFKWHLEDDGSIVREPLANGEKEWNNYFSKLSSYLKDTTSYAFLEFVMDDSPDIFYRDAALLNKLIAKANG